MEKKQNAKLTVIFLYLKWRGKLNSVGDMVEDALYRTQKSNNTN